MRRIKLKTPQIIQGVAASPGIALGPVLIYGEEQSIPQRKKLSKKSVDAEVRRFLKALKAVRQEVLQVKKKLVRQVGEYEARIFDAHILILEDPDILEAVIQKIRGERVNAEFAFMQHINQLILKFDKITDLYLHERNTDIRSLSSRVLNVLQKNNEADNSELETPVVMVAKDFPLFAFNQLHKAKTLGVVVEYGGKTSHFSILARSLEIPVLTGVPADYFSHGDYVIIDGSQGLAILNPSLAQVEEYRTKKAELELTHRKLLSLRAVSSTTKDKHRIRLMANMELPAELDRILHFNSEGIGLFRSEFLILASNRLPSEEEQFSVYSHIAKMMKDKPFIIRTFDTGGDKLVSGLSQNSELNPFMGWRSIRVCLDEVAMFKTQLRAILRASTYGNVQVMFPMISDITELDRAKEILGEVKKEMKDEKIKFNSKMKIGCVIEIPSSALQADEIAKKCDFLSIGTNDLIQFTLAVDRGNEKISKLFEPHHPSVLKLIHQVVQAAKRQGVPLSICGEMAGDPLSALLLLGMGVKELSMNVHSILEMRKFIRTLSLAETEKMWRKVRRFHTSQEVNEFLYSRYKDLSL